MRNFLFSAIALLVTFGAGPIVAADYESTVLMFNPVGYWRLNETTPVPAANIVKNSGSLGDLGNGYVVLDVTNAEPGRVGTAFRFTNPGGDISFCGSKVDVPYHPALNPNGPFTVEFWAKPASQPPPDPGTGALIGVCPASSMNPDFSIDPNDRAGWLFYQRPDDKWEFRVGGEHSSYVAAIAGGAVTINDWQHIVGVYDGATATLYVNGQKVAGPAAAPSFDPNTTRPLRIGGSLLNGALEARSLTDGNRGFDGWVDELAVYATALSADVIAAHYDAATSNNAGYGALVLASGPVGYWHLDEPVYNSPDPSTFPMAMNSGSAGASADGTYQPGATTGNAGQAAGGLGANNSASQLSGVVGNVAIGNPGELNFDGQITLIAWVKPAQVDGYPTLREIIAHGYDADGAEVSLLLDQGYYEVGSTSDGITFNAVADPMPSGDVGNWVFLAGTYDGTTWSLYRYDKLIASGDFSVGSISMDAPWSLGSRGDASTDGRFYGGGIDEVAIFNTALTAAQLQQIFYSANVSPIITEPPQAPAGPVYEGLTLSFNVAAEGNPSLSYQWTENSTPIAGQTTTTLTLSNVTTNDSGTYAVIVTNPFGSVTNSVLLSVSASAPVILQEPQPVTRFAGASVTFSVKAAGSSPLSYQWKKDSTDIPGATASSYTKLGLQSTDAGNYSCALANPLGSTNTVEVALAILPLPSGYPTIIGADNPIAYWRLGETNGIVAHEYWGGHDGQYNNVALGQLGFSVVDADKAAGFSGTNTYVGNISGTAIDFTGANTTFSLEAWANGPARQVDGAALICKGTGGGGEQFSVAVFNGKYRFYALSAFGNASVAQGSIGPDGTWQHIVGVYDGVGGAIHIYVNGVESGSGTTSSAGPRATSHPVSIGSRRSGVDPSYDLYFTGSLDEMAIYSTALAADQVLAHYNARYGSTTPPIIDHQPDALTSYVSRSVTFKVVGGGTVPLSYQWQKGTSNIQGATSDTHTIGPLALSDAGDYRVIISNSVGTNTSSTATLTVLPIPTSAVTVPGLVLHLPFDDSYADSSGRGNNGSAIGSPSFVDGKVGTKALHYSTLTSDGMPGSPVVAANYVTLGVRPDLQFGPTVNFSVAYWVRLPENTMPGDLPFIANNDYSFGGPGYTFAPSYKEGGWSWYINNKSEDPFAGIGLYSPQVNNINDGAWHHLAHTFDRTGNAVTYLDGIQVDATPIAAGAAWDLGTGKPTDIGQAGGNYTEPAESDIDDIGMWSRVLTPLEVDGIYLGGNVNGVSFTNAPTSVSITIKNLGAQIQLTWAPTGGTLEQADSLTGPWNSLGTANPQKVTNPGTGAQYFRVRVQ